MIYGAIASLDSCREKRDGTAANGATGGGECKGLHKYSRAGSAQKGRGLLINREGEKINDGSKMKGNITVFNQKNAKEAEASSKQLQGCKNSPGTEQDTWAHC